jgi:hypothetical protein
MSERPSELRSLLSGGHTLLLVLAVMLPVSGAIIRYLLLTTAGVTMADRIAVSAPLTELAAIGARSAVIALVTFTGGVLAVRLLPSHRSNWLTVTIGLLGALVTVPLLGLAAVPIVATLALAVHLGLHVRLGRDWKTAWGMSVVLLALALFAATVGLQPVAGRAGQYTFTDEALSGVYLAGGRTDSTLLLLSCHHRGSVLEVPADRLLSIVYAPLPPGPSWIDRIRGERPGLFDPCPA